MYGPDVYAINTNGSNYVILYTLNGTTEGNQPQAGVVLSGSTLYGTATDKGTGGNGTVFALTPLPIPLNLQPNGNSIVLSWLDPLLSLQSARLSPALTLTSPPSTAPAPMPSPRRSNSSA